MPLTDHSDLFASFHEDGFNHIIRHIMTQRPSLFNYSTQDLASPKYEPRLCSKIEFHLAVQEFNNPLVTVLPYMPIIGYTGPYGLSYTFQLTEFLVDFHPGNLITLPTELNPPLNEQRIALKGKVCGGVSCPEREITDKLIDELIDIPQDPTGKDRPDPEPPTKPIPSRKVECFCLELYATLQVIRSNGFIQLRLDGLELVDILPNGLENSLECYISTSLRLGILPKVRIALNDLVFSMNDFITIAPAPVTGDIPFNPSVSNNQLNAFLNLI